MSNSPQFDYTFPNLPNLQWEDILANVREMFKGPKKSQKGMEQEERLRYQFWPDSMSMGSLIGNKFTQTFGAVCENGEDRAGNGRSHVAFDFTREVLVIKANFHRLSPADLPRALSPLDAELSFDDITSQGLHFYDKPHPYEHDKVSLTLTVSCKRPPKFSVRFEGKEDGDRFCPGKRRATAMDFAVTRVAEKDAGPIPAIPQGPCSYPTFWNTWRWTFTLSQEDIRRFKACAHKIFLLGQEDAELDLRARKSEAWEMQLARNVVKAPESTDMPDLSQEKLPFSTRALIEGLVAHGILLPFAVTDLITALRKHAAVPTFRDRVLESLFSEDRIRNPEAVVRGKASFLRRTDLTVLPHLVMIRTVLVTPTRILCGPLQQEPSNSVTRQYKDRLDGIIRVNFTDEEDRLMIDPWTKTADKIKGDVGVMARVRRALQHGVRLGGRRFMPVASSSSQQKDHAMWFVDPKIIDIVELKSWMGDVEETIVAKHAARMGLPFSSTRIVDFAIHLGPELKDVEKNKHCFTDGCGIAGQEVMRQSATALGITVGVNACPSAIQFRLGGAKGVLSYWPHLVKDHEVRLRKSQIKFESKLTDLNVARIAKYQVAFLNRQFVMMMCANGVSEDLIIHLFNENVTNIRGLVNRVQTGTVTKEDKGLLAQCHEFPLQTLIKNGFNNDPLVLDIVRIIECRTLQDLKWRARLRLPTGVFLIGIADESGLLKEGEIFCQFQESLERPAIIVKQEVVICRAPALHPGDVRRAFAVDVPELRHLKNVIVFSIQGERDLPNMLGGGDLDGDDYTLIWDPRFVSVLKVAEPMNYTAPPPIRVPRVTQADLNENFVQFMLNDVLGQVDNCHLALADTHTPFHPKCLQLSEIHSTAVDFAKTGQAADLVRDLRPEFWPDFMDKDPKKTYVSEGILGKLFRLVQPEPHFTPSDLKELHYPTDPRFSRFPVIPKLIDRLKPIKAYFEHCVNFDMRRYQTSEAEIAAGIALKNKHRKRARDQNLNEPLKDSYNIHISAAREAVLKEVSCFTFVNTKLTTVQIAARHCYALTFERQYVEEWEKQVMSGLWDGYGEDEEKDELRQGAMKTFAWVFWQELIQLVNPGFQM